MVSEGSLESFNYLESGASLSLIKFDGPQDFNNVRSKLYTSYNTLVY